MAERSLFALASSGADAMARYFFNLHDSISIPDDVGTEHADIESVRTEAIETMAERLKGAMLRKADISAWLMNVTDERGLTVIMLSFSAAIQVVDQMSLATARAAAS
jgi:hypothetical protein